jgi:CheY-specific phosphatase CheX
MFTQYFGNYLFESSVISMSQFKEALQQIKDKRAKLGVLAIQAGYMTPPQVEETIAMQLQVDKKFGEIAVQKGYITYSQLEKLLVKQGSPFAIFSQIMIDNDYMTYSELSKHFENYKKTCGMTDESFSKFQEDEITPLVEKIIPSYADSRRDTVVRAYIELFIRNIMRFVNDNVTIGNADKAQLVQSDWTAYQTMYGTLDIIASFSGSEDALRYIACKFAKVDYTDFDLLVRDVLGEFLNCVNGIFIAAAQEYDVDLDLKPQYVTNDCKSAQTNDMCSIYFSIDNYQYQLNLAF